MPRVYTEVDVELDEIDDEDLIEELKNRGRRFEVNGQVPAELVIKIHERRRLGQDYQQELDELIYVTIGKII
jgi:hypothetical protein